MPRYFHVTPAENIQAILLEGLVPKIGVRSAQQNEQSPGIYLFSDTASIEDACSGWLGECFDDDVDLALFAIDSLETFPANPGVEYETMVSEVIPRQNITLLSRDLLNETDLKSLAMLPHNINSLISQDLALVGEWQGRNPEDIIIDSESMPLKRFEKQIFECNLSYLEFPEDEARIPYKLNSIKEICKTASPTVKKFRP